VYLACGNPSKNNRVIHNRKIVEGRGFPLPPWGNVVFTMIYYGLFIKYVNVILY
jgi:hypothetical protein